MKKLFKLLFVLTIALCFVLPAQAALKQMWADVYRLESTTFGSPTLTKITTGITFRVLQRNSDTAETLYRFGDSALTSVTNPVTTANFALATVCKNKVRFQVDPGEATDTYVDLIVVDTAGGYTVFVEDFDSYTHKIVIDERPNVQHHGFIWFNDDTTDETDTGIDFDYDTKVTDVVVEVTGATTEAISVGLLAGETAGDANGFVEQTALSSTGYIAKTLGSSGALLDDGTNFNPDGHMIESANAQSLTYTLGTGSGVATTLTGYIHYFFTRMR